MKTHGRKKILTYDIYNQLLIAVTLFFGILLGRYFLYQDSRNIFVGLIAGAIGGIILVVIEKNIRSRANYEKGSKLEDTIALIMESMGYTCKQSIATGNGDLDILAIKDNKYYGIESKSVSGAITFSNGTLYVANRPHNDYLDRLLANCKIVRNKEYGTDSNVFIEPVVVFGYGATLQNIPKEGIKYGRTTIKICSVMDIRADLS
jgi:hypothetical protein